MSQTTRSVREMVADPDTHASTLLVWMADACGDLEFTTWAPETVRREAEHEAGAPLSEGNFSRLMAAVLVLTTDLFFKDVPSFVHVANVLSGDDGGPGDFDPADATECAWAVTEGLLISPHDDEDPEPFSHEVRVYIGQALREEGFLRAPDVLGIAVMGDPLADAVRAHGTDRAVMREAMRVQEEREQAVRAAVRGNLDALCRQIEALPLRTGDAKDFLKKVKGVTQWTR